MPDSHFRGDSLEDIITQLADEGHLLEFTAEDTVQMTEEGFDTLMGLLAVTSLSAKYPINEHARRLGEAIGRELAQWRNKMN